MKINVGDILEMKKEHPCGERHFEVIRVGSDVRIRCAGCSHELTLGRVKLERMVKNIIPKEKNNQ
ncbi:MAG: DUF951 domain-containing protein [Firmicutes bacterium]|nr:DUF951 domain-containing protein [Bacillota bacterium]